MSVGSEVSESARGACAVRPDVGVQCDQGGLVSVDQLWFTADQGPAGTTSDDVRTAAEIVRVAVVV